MLDLDKASLEAHGARLSADRVDDTIDTIRHDSLATGFSVRDKDIDMLRKDCDMLIARYGTLKSLLS